MRVLFLGEFHMSLVRYPVVMFLSVGITILLFVIMYGLVRPVSDIRVNENSQDVNFSYVRNFEEIKNTNRKEKDDKLPEPEKAKPALARPVVAAETESMPMDGISQSDFPTVSDLAINTSWSGLPAHGISGGTAVDHGGSIKSAIAPLYPPEALRNKIEGWVDVLIAVDAKGKVLSVKVLDASHRRIFDAAAVKGVRKWIFNPKIVNGQAASFEVRQKIEFVIDGA